MAGGAFAPTQWSLVARAAAGHVQSGEALERLCRAYLPPVFAFIRREGHSVDDAMDLTQEFFSRLLASDSFATADPAKGRFRSWLIGALRHFLHTERRRARRLKRGGGVAPLSLDDMEPGLREACEPRATETPETAYDRRWAETVVSRVLTRLRREFELAGQLERYDALRVYLPQSGPAPAYAETMERTGLSEAAVKSAIHKLRRRFGLLLRHEVMQTLADPADADDELRSLLAALR